MALTPAARPQRLGGRIGRRLALLGLLNFAGFALIVAILILAFRAVEEMTSAAAEGQMARAALNSSAVRQVSGLYPLTRLLTAALREPDGHLALAGAELRRTLDEMAAGSLNPAARAAFKALSEQLPDFVADGERIAALLALVHAREVQALAAMAHLEQSLTDLRVDSAQSGAGWGGNADGSLAGLQRRLVAARERLLDLSREHAARSGMQLAEVAEGTAAPDPARGGPLAATPPLATQALADLDPGLREAAAAAPSLGEAIEGVRADLAAYADTERALAQAYVVLAGDLRRLRTAELDSLRLMSQLDLDASAQADRFRQSILDIMMTSAVYAVALALVVVLAVILLILVILRRQIKEPMEGVIARVSAISGGAFQLKPLERGDEWDAIQTALTDMAAELSRSLRALTASEARYRILVDNQSDLVIKLDAERCLVFVNPSLCEALGLTEADLLGRPCLPLIHPDDPAAAGAALDRLGEPPHHCQIEQRTHTPQGWRWYAWAYRAVPTKDGAPAAVIGVGRDVTARKDAEAAVEAQRRFLHTVVDAVPDPVLVIDANHQVRMANAAAHRLYAWDDGAWADGEGVCCRQITHRSALPCSASGDDCFLEQVLASGTGVRALHRHHLAGEERYMEVAASPYWGPDGRIEGIVEVARDITEELAAQERVQFLAHHDVLTGLPNRALLCERFAAAAQAAGAAAERTQIGLLYLDLDHFKRVNDSLGHHVGDLMLQEVARRLSAAVRKTDTVSRQGGDEFLVVLPGLQEAQGALPAAEHIAAALEAPLTVDGHEVTATFSIGIAVLPDDGADFDTLLKNADLAMYAAKAAGRNTVRRYSPGMERRTGHG